MNDKFKLYDLEIIVEGDPKTFVCSHKLGLGMTVIGENIKTIQDIGFSYYSFASLLPLMSVKQRPTVKNDWISTDELISCPDPHCGAKFRINRVASRSFSHDETTKVPLKKRK
jgi:uncharacterized repeat protein (TIGR04076 family)